MTSLKLLSVYAFGLVGAGFLSFVGPTPALASQSYYLINMETERCLISPGAGNNVISLQHNCRNDNSREWVFTRVGDGVYKIRNVQSGKCLTISGGRSTENNVRALQYDCDNDPSRRWRLRSGHSKDVFQLQNVQTGKCLTIAGGRSRSVNVEALQYNCDDDRSRFWQIRQIHIID